MCLKFQMKMKGVVDFVAERGLCMGNIFIYFKRMYIRKYTRVDRGGLNDN